MFLKFAGTSILYVLYFLLLLLSWWLTAAIWMWLQPNSEQGLGFAVALLTVYGLPLGAAIILPVLIADVASRQVDDPLGLAIFCAFLLLQIIGMYFLEISPSSVNSSAAFAFDHQALPRDKSHGASLGRISEA